MATYRVTATFTYIATVEAGSEDEAMEAILDLDTTDMDLFDITPVEADLIDEDDDTTGKE